MRLLLDTHLLIWAAHRPDRLSPAAITLMTDRTNRVAFSAVSLWEVAVKRALDKTDFGFDARALRRGLLDEGFVELSLTGPHALAVDALPPLHKDPFDRMLLAQAMVDGFLLLTADATIARYPGPVRRV